MRRILARLRKVGAAPNLQQQLHVAENIINNVMANRTTGMTPAETTNKQAPKVLLKLKQQRAKIREKLSPGPPFEIGNKVLLSTRNGAFRKSGDDRFGSEMFTIVGIKESGPMPSYRLRDSGGADLTGTYPPSRLTLVKRQLKREASPVSKSTEYSPPVTRSKALITRQNGSQTSSKQ